MKTFKYFLNGVLAGVLISIGSIANIACLAYDTNGVLKVFGAVLFSLGLLGVCFLKANLYTGKIGFIFEEHCKDYTIETFIGLLGNLVGAILIASLFALLSGSLSATTTNIVNNKIDNFSILSTLASSIFCGILIYLGVYLFKKVEHPLLKSLFIILCVTIFVIAGFDHCIANAFYFMVYIMKAEFNPTLLLMLLIAICGNTIGSLLLYSLTKSLDVITNKEKIKK
jgi:Formate/nitrite family of transporters